jgi:redox-sensitive bicupin YhaK (pirin superfamily)
MDRTSIEPCHVELRLATEHGRTVLGGLSGLHHFCFAGFQRADRMEWGPLRAVHEFTLQPGAGRPPSLHAGFEILTLVSEGRLRRTGRWAPREAMAAGAVELVHSGAGADIGVTAVGDVPARYFEIWAKVPRIHGEPRRTLRARAPRGFARPIASNRPSSVETLRWDADARLARATLAADATLKRRLEPGDCIYVVLRTGRLETNGVVANAGDALAISGPGRLRIVARLPADFYWFRGHGAVEG